MERDAVTATLQRVEAGGSGAAAVAMYEAVTGLRLSRDKESGKFFCEILESDPLSQADETAAACVKFSLSVEENGDISYAPGTVREAKLPEFLSEEISFHRSQGPLFFAQMLNSVFDVEQGVEEEDEEEEEEEEKEEEKEEEEKEERNDDATETSRAT